LPNGRPLLPSKFFPVAHRHKTELGGEHRNSSPPFFFFFFFFPMSPPPSFENSSKEVPGGGWVSGNCVLSFFSKLPLPLFFRGIGPQTAHWRRRSRKQVNFSLPPLFFRLFPPLNKCREKGESQHPGRLRFFLFFFFFPPPPPPLQENKKKARGPRPPFLHPFFSPFSDAFSLSLLKPWQEREKGTEGGKERLSSPSLFPRTSPDSSPLLEFKNL